METNAPHISRKVTGRRWRIVAAALGAVVTSAAVLGVAQWLTGGPQDPGVTVAATDRPGAGGGLDAAQPSPVSPGVGAANPQPVLVDIGAPADFPVGVSLIEEHQVFLVAHPMGWRAAYSWLDPESGCRIVTVASPEGQALGGAPPEALFVDPCRLGYYDALGWLIGEPWPVHRMTQYQLSLMADSNRLSLIVNERVPLPGGRLSGWPSDEEMAADVGAQAWRGRVDGAVPAKVSVGATTWQTPAGRPRTLAVFGHSLELSVEFFVHEPGAAWTPAPGLEPGANDALRRSIPQGELVAGYTDSQSPGSAAQSPWVAAELLAPDGVHLRLIVIAAGTDPPTPDTVANWLTSIASRWRAG